MFYSLAELCWCKNQFVFDIFRAFQCFYSLAELCWCKNQFVFDISRAFQCFYSLAELCWCKNQFVFDMSCVPMFFILLLSCVGARISLCLINVEYLVRSNVFILLLSKCWCKNQFVFE